MAEEYKLSEQAKAVYASMQKFANNYINRAKKEKELEAGVFLPTKIEEEIGTNRRRNELAEGYSKLSPREQEAIMHKLKPDEKALYLGSIVMRSVSKELVEEKGYKNSGALFDEMVGTAPELQKRVQHLLESAAEK